jgi:hypothetical protein
MQNILHLCTVNKHAIHLFAIVALSLVGTLHILYGIRLLEKY